MNVAQRITALGVPSILPTVQRTSDRTAKIRVAVGSLYGGASPLSIVVGECPAIIAQAMTALRGAGYSDAAAKAEMSKALVWGGNANLFRTWYMAARDDLNMTFSMASTMTPFFDALSDVYCMFTFDTTAYVAWAPQSISFAGGNSIARFGDNDPVLNVPGWTNPAVSAAPAPIVDTTAASTATSTVSSSASASAIASASASAIATASAAISSAALAGSAVVSTVTSIAGTALDKEIVTQTTNAAGAVATSVTSTAPLAAGETIQQRIARMLATAQAVTAVI